MASTKSKPPSRAKQPAARPRRPPKVVAVAPAQPDEFSAMGGMPVVTLQGVDRSDGGRAVKDLSWAEFDGLVQQLAEEVRAAHFKPDAVIGLVHGGVFVGGALASALKAEFFPLRVTRRHRDRGQAAGEEVSPELAGRRVLVVDDISSSGDSLEFALKLAKAAKVKHLASVALLTRPDGYQPNFTGFTSDAFVIFPWDYYTMTRDQRFEPPAADVAPPSRAPKKSKGRPRA